MKRWLLIAVFTMTALVAGAVHTAYAAWPDDGELTGCYTWDFSEGQGGWAMNYNTSYGASGFIANDYETDDYKHRVLQVNRTIVDTTITSITITYDYTQGYVHSSVWDHQAVSIQKYHDSVWVELNTISFAAITNGTDKTRTWSGSVVADKIVIFIRPAKDLTEPYTTGGSATLKKVEVCGSSETDYIRPLLPQQLGSWGMIEHEYDDSPENVVVAFSDQPGRPVRTPTDATVVSIQKVTPADCADILGIDYGGYLQELYCALWLSGETIGESDGKEVEVFATEQIYKTDSYVVTLVDEEDVYFKYLVRDAPDFVEINQEILAGCYIGRTEVMYLVRGAVWGGSAFSQGVTVAVRYETPGDYLEFLDYLILSPLESAACNASYSYCLGNPELTTENDWGTIGAVAFDDPGFTLGAGGTISTVMNLDDDREPELTVGAKSLSGTGSVLLQLGQTALTVQPTAGAIQDYVIAGDAHQPDAGTFYNVEVTNTGNTSIEVRYICVAFTKDENGDPLPDKRPETTGCYFANHSFDDGTANWTVANAWTRPGELIIPSLDVFSQSATLYPADGGAQTYTVSATIALDYYYAFVPDETNTTESITVSYEYPSGGGYTSIDTITFGDLAYSGNLVTLDTTFSVVAQTTSAFGFKASIGGSPTNVVGVAFREVCIESGDTTDGSDPEPFPGDYLDDYPIPDTATCTLVSKPAGGDVWAWIVWLWANLNNFFQCELMPLLNSWYQKFLDLFQLIGWLGRWSQAAMGESMEWFAWQLVPWLGGYFDNMRGGGWIVDSGDDDSCAWYDLFCWVGKLTGGIGDLIGDVTGGIGDIAGWLAQAVDDLISGIGGLLGDLLGVLGDVLGYLAAAATWVFDILGDLLGVILDWVGDIVSAVVMWAGRLWSLVDGIINAYNDATPQTVAGFPDCATPQSHDICLFYWICENTLFAGTAGSLIIPLMASILAIMMVLSYIDRIKKTLVTSGEVS